MSEKNEKEEEKEGTKKKKTLQVPRSFPFLLHNNQIPP